MRIVKRPWTKVRIANYILQIFFIRLTRCSQNDILKLYVDEPLSIFNDKGLHLSTEYKADIKQTYWFSIQFWVVPFTGWGILSSMKTLGKPKFIRVTRKMLVNNLSYPAHPNCRCGFNTR